MVMSQFTPSDFARLSSLELRDAITAYEQIAQSHFDKAKKHEGCIHAAALVIRENQRGCEAQWKANYLRAVLAVRRKEHQRRQRFVNKCLEAQKLAHYTLEVSRA